METNDKDFFRYTVYECEGYAANNHVVLKTNNYREAEKKARQMSKTCHSEHENTWCEVADEITQSVNFVSHAY